MGLCLATGLAGNVFPFMAWFNKHEYRVRMILSSNHTAIYVGARSSIALGFSWCLRSRASGPCSRCRCCIRGRRCTASSVRRSSCALPPLTAHRCFTRSASHYRPCRSIPPVIPHRARVLRGPFSRARYPCEHPAQARRNRWKYVPRTFVHYCDSCSRPLRMNRLACDLALLYCPRCEPASDGAGADEARDTVRCCMI